MEVPIMADKKSKTTIATAEILIEKKVKDNNTYWTKYTWDKDKPVVLVLANYPGKLDILEEDLTTMLIKNEVYRLGDYGTVVIANLFTKPISRNIAGERTLSEAYEIDSMSEIVNVTKEVDKVIIAVGSLTNRFQIASDRLAMYGQMCSDEGQLDKIVELANGQHEPKHPLALQGDNWTLTSWTFDWENPPKARSKKKVAEKDE